MRKETVVEEGVFGATRTSLKRIDPSWLSAHSATIASCQRSASSPPSYPPQSDFSRAAAQMGGQIGFGGQQQVVDELRARVREAEAEKQRLQVEVERLRSSAQAIATT